MAKKYLIILNGCDDATQFEIELTPKQLDLLKLLKSKSEEISMCSCEPTLNIKTL